MGTINPRVRPPLVIFISISEAENGACNDYHKSSSKAPFGYIYFNFRHAHHTAMIWIDAWRTLCNQNRIINKNLFYYTRSALKIGGKT